MTNVYDLVDKELDRLHSLLKVCIEKEMICQNNNSYYPPGASETTTIFKQIMKFQNMIIDSYQANDAELQKLIAERALVGGNDETVSPREG